MAVTPRHTGLVTGAHHLTIFGSFRPDDDNDPSVVNGKGFSVVHTSTGVWTVTLDQTFVDFVAVHADAQLATSDADLHHVRGGDRSVANRTIDLIHMVSSNTSTTHPVVGDITSNAANWIHFGITVALVDIPGAGV